MRLLKPIMLLPMRQLKARRRRARFDAICKHCGLKLDYALNNPGVPILEEVFVQRIYADYFPFYQRISVLDVGGHFGYFAIFAALNSAPGSRIVTVEPSAQNWQVLQANVGQMGLDQIRIVHGAVAEHTGTATVHVTQAHNCSLIADHAREFAADGALSSESVQTFSLADMLDQNGFDTVDVLKLDCEGAEYSIIFQSPESVLRRVKVIMMEFHDLKDEHHSGLTMVEQLERKGFRVVHFRHLPTTMNLNYGKIIAVHG